MNRLSWYIAKYEEFSGKLSDVNRNLAFAGIAVVWVFKQNGSGGPVIPLDLLLPLQLFVYALTFDLLHYVSATIAWGCFQKYHDIKTRDLQGDPQIDSHESYLNWAPFTFFVLKIAALVLAYYLLMIRLPFMLCV